MLQYFLFGLFLYSIHIHSQKSIYDTCVEILLMWVCIYMGVYIYAKYTILYNYIYVCMYSISDTYKHLITIRHKTYAN